VRLMENPDSLITDKNGQQRMGVVHWANLPGTLGKSGHGSPIPLEVALATVQEQNKRWGEGTHWVEENA